MYVCIISHTLAFKKIIIHAIIPYQTTVQGFVLPAMRVEKWDYTPTKIISEKWQWKRVKGRGREIGGKG